MIYHSRVPPPSPLSLSPPLCLSLLLNPHRVVCSSQSGTHSLSHHLPPRSQQRHSGSLCCSFICSDLFFAHERLQLPEGSASQLLVLKRSLKPKGMSAWMPRMNGCFLLSFVSDVLSINKTWSNKIISFCMCVCVSDFHLNLDRPSRHDDIWPAVMATGPWAVFHQRGQQFEDSLCSHTQLHTNTLADQFLRAYITFMSCYTT